MANIPNEQTVYGIDDAVSAYLAQNNGGGSGEGGGQTVTVTPTLNAGTEVAKITVGLNTKTLYAPTPAQPGDKVTVSRKVSTGTNIADITVNGTTTKLYAPTSGGTGGSTITVTPALNSGTKVADITVDGVNKVLYAPTPSGGGQGGSTVSVERTLNTGTKIATLTIDGAGTDLYAPTPSGQGGGSTVSVNRKLSSGTNIADLTIDGVTTQLYAPAGGGGGGGTAASDIAMYAQTITLEQAVNSIAVDANEDTAFYAFGRFNQNGTSSGTFSVYGVDGDNNDHLIATALSFSTNSDTYFGIYGKHVADGRWVCWVKTGNTPMAAPSGSGTSVGSGSFHALCYDTTNAINTIVKLKITGSKAIKSGSTITVYTTNEVNA